MATNRVDPITGAVIQGALENIAIEMGHKLMRMSYSSIIRESEDFGAALTDAQGNQLCECKMSTPLQSGPIPGYIRGVRARFAARGDVFRPGDVIMHNDPYGGASHGPDVAFCVPVFEGETLLGFSVTTAHHLDIGAHTPGSCGIVDAVDAYAEGLQFKALKVIDAGCRNEPLWHMIRDNIRISDLVRQYSHATVMAASADLMDYSERLMRAAIAKLPDGVYRATTYIDGFLDDPEPSRRDFAICVAITVAGDELTVDLTGAAPQAPDRPINMPFEGHRHQGAGRRRQPLPGRGRHARSRPRRSQRRRRLLRLQFRRHHDGQQNLSASQGLSAYRGSRSFRPGARIGPGVTAFRPGDRVAAFSQDAGGFAECCVVPTERLIAIPDAMALDAAAAFPIQALTAWHLLHNVSVTKPGDVILLHAIGGGLGLLATQLALKAGATVVGTVGARGKEARALESGASLVVNRNDEDFVEALMRFTGGRGVDKIVNSTGGDILDRSFGCIRRLGHVVSFGEAAGRPFANLWERLVAKSLTFSRFHLGHVDFHGEAWKTRVNEVIADILAGRLIVRVEQVFAFAQAGSMLERLASRNVSGKLLLAMAPGLK